MAYEAGQLRRDRDAKNSIIITWQISFDHIQQERPSAANLLSLMSFFDQQGIPESLLWNKSRKRCNYKGLEDQDEDNSNEGSDEENSDSEVSILDEFEDDISALRNYRFIFVNLNRTTF